MGTFPTILKKNNQEKIQCVLNIRNYRGSGFKSCVRQSQLWRVTAYTRFFVIRTMLLEQRESMLGRKSRKLMDGFQRGFLLKRISNICDHF